MKKILFYLSIVAFTTFSTLGTDILPSLNDEKAIAFTEEIKDDKAGDKEQAVSVQISSICNLFIAIGVIIILGIGIRSLNSGKSNSKKIKKIKKSGIYLVECSFIENCIKLNFFKKENGVQKEVTCGEALKLLKGCDKDHSFSDCLINGIRSITYDFYFLYFPWMKINSLDKSFSIEINKPYYTKNFDTKGDSFFNGTDTLKPIKNINKFGDVVTAYTPEHKPVLMVIPTAINKRDHRYAHIAKFTKFAPKAQQ